MPATLTCILRGGLRLRAALGELSDGYVELLFVAPLHEDSWSVIQQGLNDQVDIDSALGALGEPVMIAALRNACAGFGVPWQEVMEDSTHISHMQARALNGIARSVDQENAVGFLAAIPTDELKALRRDKLAASV